MDEKNAIKEVKDGKKEAYRFIVEKYTEKAFYYALAILGNEQDAFDASQEAFIKAYRNIKRFDSEKPFYPWFFKILKNTCFSYMKKKKREMAFFEYIEIRNRKKEDRMLLRLREAWEMLEDKSKEILWLKYFQGFSYKEIAEILSIPLGTVMSRLYYTRKKLEELMK